MSRAVCRTCGKAYYWNARRGNRLSDNLSPCCHSKGNAIRHTEFTETVIKYCPICDKAGLRFRDTTGQSAYSFAVSREYKGHRYCPRCKQWVVPRREERHYSGDVVIHERA